MTVSSGTELAVSAVFGLFVAMTVAGGLIAVLTARIIRSVCGLALCCLGLAGLYYFLHSPFLSLMEILIYIGAVCVTVIFAVMLAEPEETRAGEERGRSRFLGIAAALVSVAVFLGVWRLGQQVPWAAPATRATDGSVKAIGAALLSTYGLAFELISLVLLTAILGALVIARTGRTKP